MKLKLCLIILIQMSIHSTVYCQINKKHPSHRYHGEYDDVLEMQIKSSFPKRMNVFFMVDVSCVYIDYTVNLLKNVFSKMSLMKYRISVYTSSGVSQGILLFQCRGCTINKLRVPCNRNTTVADLINKMEQENEDFLREGNIVVMVTDQYLQSGIIKKLRQMYDNKGVYIIKIDGGGVDKNNTHQESNEENAQLHERKVKEELTSLPFIQEDLNLCDGNEIIYDECQQKCRCVHGVIDDCYRIRKEFSSMLFQDRLKLVGIYKTISSPGMFYSKYHGYVKMHNRYFSKGIHQPYLFLPWHRRLLLEHENLYRLIDCRVTQPFWNWSLYEKILWSRTPTYHIWDDVGGFGGDGQKELSNCVTTGAFSVERWQTPHFEQVNCILQEVCFEGKVNIQQRRHCATLTWNISVRGFDTRKSKKYAKECFLRNRHNYCLRRRFDGISPSLEDVKNTISYYNVTYFAYFESLLRFHWHTHVHKIVGGQMGTDYTANAPEFYLHHGMIDAIWEKWQSKGDEYMTVGYPGTYTRLIGFEPPEYRHDYLNNSNLAGCRIKICYEDTHL